MENKVHKMKIAGLERSLPICRINDELSIAAFIMFSDVDLTVKCAEQLIKKTPEFDIIFTAEAKGIPLAYEMSRQSGKTYIVARKMSKLYMKDPIEIEVKSISTARMQRLFLDSGEMEMLNGKRILIVDDVISTGGSLYAMEEMVKKSTGTVVGKAAVLAEGVAAERDDISYLEVLPLFDGEGNLQK